MDRQPRVAGRHDRSGGPPPVAGYNWRSVGPPPTKSTAPGIHGAHLTSDKCQFTLIGVIRTFRHRGLKRLFEEGDASRIRPDLVEKVENILSVLDSAVAPQHLDLPGYRLHPLKGDLKGYWAVTVRANWRIVFRLKDGDAFDVDFVDYH